MLVIDSDNTLAFSQLFPPFHYARTEKILQIFLTHFPHSDVIQKTTINVKFYCVKTYKHIKCVLIVTSAETSAGRYTANANPALYLLKMRWTLLNFTQSQSE